MQHSLLLPLFLPAGILLPLLNFPCHAVPCCHQIDIAMPMLMALKAEAHFEVRTPRQFKVRFHKVLEGHLRE